MVSQYGSKPDANILYHDSKLKMNEYISRLLRSDAIY